MASNDTSSPRRKRTASEDNSDDEFDEIETLREKGVELYHNEKKAEEARRAKTQQTSTSSESEPEAKKARRAETSEARSSDQSETGSESDHKVLLMCLTEDLYMHQQRATRHVRVDRLEEFVKLLASLPKGVQDGIASANAGKDLLVKVLAEAAVSGSVELITLFCRTAQFKENEMKHAARMAFLFQRTDVIEAFAQLGFDMNEDGFLADVMALTPAAWLVSCGSSSSCTQETRSHLALLKAALQGDQTQVVQCLDEVGRTGEEPADSSSESEDEDDYCMECHRRVLVSDKRALTKKDVINIAILLTVARGHHQALRVLLEHAGSTWKDAVTRSMCIAQFHTTPINLAVIRGNVHTVQVLLDQVQGEFVSDFPDFLISATLHERLDIVRYLVRQAKALINVPSDACGYYDHSLLLEAIHYALFTAIERRSRSAVKLIFEEFTKEELQLSDSHSIFLDHLVQNSKSLPILRAFLLWCPDYVKKQLQIKPSLEEVWPLGYSCLLQAGGEVKNRNTLPNGSISEERLQLGLQETCLQFVRLHLHKPIQDSVKSVPVPNRMKLRLQFKFPSKKK